MINIPNLIFAIIMGGLMSLSITLATTLVRVGLVQNFFWIWMEVWSVAYPVAIICILIYRPFASKLTANIMKKIVLGAN
jgi:membrane protein implicated in regulation of membrane protease activity